MNVYVYQAALLCADCGLVTRIKLRVDGKAPADQSDERTYDSDDFPKGPYPDGGGESDSPDHCGMCGVFLENPLTLDGVEYVRESLRIAREEFDGVECHQDCGRLVPGGTALLHQHENEDGRCTHDVELAKLAEFYRDVLQ